jgi:dienelactone hydrolase
MRWARGYSITKLFLVPNSLVVQVFTAQAAMKLIVLSCLIAAPTLAHARPDPVPQIEMVTVDGIGPNAAKVSMQVQVYLPNHGKTSVVKSTRTGAVAQPTLLPVLLYAHGRPAYASARAKFKRPIHARHVQYWLDKGYAVVAPIRPGYGTPPHGTGGADQESSGVGYSATGQCIKPPNPANLAIHAAHAQRAALDWVRLQPWAKADHIVLEGQSGGGLATVALCAANPPGVRGCINFSGGAGGDPANAPGNVCAPEKITALMQQYGASTRAPSVWLYAPNDLYWGAAAPQQWHSAFNAAAALNAANQAQPSTLIQTPPIGSDGHSLQRAGSKQWAPPLNAWLRKNKL